MQAFIVNRVSQPSPFAKAGKADLRNDPRKKKLTPAELASMTEEERRRHENSTYGDAIDDRLEEFFSKHQDVNHQSGNS